MQGATCGRAEAFPATWPRRMQCVCGDVRRLSFAFCNEAPDDCEMTLALLAQGRLKGRPSLEFEALAVRFKKLHIRQQARKAT